MPTDEILQRVYAVADELYAKSETGEFPTVDEVRRSAKINMNDANAGMKLWRKKRTALTIPLTVQIPDLVKQAFDAALAVMWQQAQELANESFSTAQKAWETERSELDVINRQMAVTFDSLSAEHEMVKSRIGDLEGVNKQLVEEQTKMKEQTRIAEARLEELRAARQQSAAEALRLAEQIADIKKQRDDNKSLVSKTNQDLNNSQAQIARLQGQVDTLTGQNKDLLARIKPPVVQAH